MRLSVNTGQDRGSRTLSSWLQRSWYTPAPLPPTSPLRCLLALAATLYASGLHYDQRRAMQRRRELPTYVISVGNLVVGGAGKTPLCLWLARHLHSLGWKPAILSRGYRRHHAGTARAPATGESAAAALAFGDEPVLMAHRAKPVAVWVGKDRWEAGKLAMVKDNVNLLILDDGFQHLALKRNLDLVLLDARNPLGNGALLPAGPLREPPAHLARADGLVLTRADDPKQTAVTRAKISQWFPGKPLFCCSHRLTGLRVGLEGQNLPIEALHGVEAVAFAGIARPESFFDLLQQEGVVVSRGLAFPDHHRYCEADLLLLLRTMKAYKTGFLITTEKDMVRLPPEFQTFTLASLLDLDFGSQHDAFCDFLKARLPRSRRLPVLKDGIG